jgi:signal transduction histidine kinase
MDGPRLPDEDEIRLIQGLSEHACIAVKNAQMYQRSREGQERLRALSDRLIEVREDERRMLANELHDGFGQALTVLSLSLETAEREMQAARQARAGCAGDGRPNDDHAPRRAEDAGPMGAVERPVIERLRAQVRLLLQKARDLSQDLRPGVLDDLGLFPALLDYCERYTRQTGVTVHVRQKGALRRFKLQEETTTFRVAQEALTNIARHAQVDEAHMLLWCDDELLGLRIEDHGVGFESTRFEATSALGGMQEWAALCGGSLEIESIVGQGTTLTLEIPLSANDRREGPNDDH